MRWVAVALGAALLCSCTTGAYQPGVARLTKAAEIIGPLASEEALALRHEYRVSLLQSTPVAGIALPKLVCEPLAYTAEPLGSSTEVADFGRAATDVATVPEKPS